ncbi:MAG TPA: sterol desaturase family protein [Pseudobdellovibrionaceae bacterium]|nr:sterol desaturase family protein [Pseudobdellovibrionaceae bacterium]
MWSLLALALGVVYAEFVGYWTHVLLHSEHVPWLSKSHMLHHLRDYGPKKPLHRDGDYLSSADGRSNILGLGLEWFLPLAVVIGTTILCLTLLGIPALYQALFTSAGLLWGHFLFGAMHTSMHQNDFWMLRFPVLKTWYLRLRARHDFHHLQFSDEGRMLKNYGICFFWFDRILGTYAAKPQKFNHAGYEAALKRYKNLLG